MLRERCHPSSPQHSTVLTRPRLGKKNKLRGVFNSEIWELMSMQTPAQTEPVRFCIVPEPDPIRSSRIPADPRAVTGDPRAVTGDPTAGTGRPSAPPGPTSPRALRDPQKPQRVPGCSAPGWPQEPPGPRGSAPAGTPLATSSPSGPPPLRP